MTRAKIIVNPYSGRWKAKAAIPDIERVCQKIGLDYELVATDAPGHGTEFYLEVRLLAVACSVCSRMPGPSVASRGSPG